MYPADRSLFYSGRNGKLLCRGICIESGPYWLTIKAISLKGPSLAGMIEIHHEAIPELIEYLQRAHNEHLQDTEYEKNVLKVVN